MGLGCVRTKFLEIENCCDSGFCNISQGLYEVGSNRRAWVNWVLVDFGIWVPKSGNDEPSFSWFYLECVLG